jgi:hypothetical protein
LGFAGLLGGLMREPLKQKAKPTQQISRISSIAAPVGGWNARDAIAEMKPGDAIRLLNWYVRATDLVIRGGQEDYSSGITGSTKTLAVYNGANGTNKMFAATNSGIYDTSSAGAVGASVATSTNGYWQTENFGDGTTNWLIMVNGTDKPNYYSGAAWTAVDSGTSPALTGLTTTSIIGVFSHNKRLWFLEKDSLSGWYLAAGAAGGALTKFDFSSIAKRGGYLIAGGTWSVESGDGPDDRAVFVTSEGEVIVYQGTNPSAATSWALVGVYYIGKPLGRRCLVKVGGDLIVITQRGAFPLSSTLQSAVIDRNIAVTNKIELAFQEAAILYQAVVGWEAIFYPQQSALLFNIPLIAGSSAEQYVVNISSPRKPWCRFTGWNANCFALYNNELYYGVDTAVQKAWVTTMSDDGANIVADAKEAFQQFGSGEQKRCNLYRPILQVNGSISFLTGLDVDFKDTNLAGEATYTVTSAAQWDVSKFDEGYWAADLDIVRRWRAPKENVGTWFAGKLRVSTNALEVHWLASDLMFELGAGI